jgi:hypothetical protein
MPKNFNLDRHQTSHGTMVYYHSKLLLNLDRCDRCCGGPSQPLRRVARGMVRCRCLVRSTIVPRDARGSLHLGSVSQLPHPDGRSSVGPGCRNKSMSRLNRGASNSPCFTIPRHRASTRAPMPIPCRAAEEDSPQAVTNEDERVEHRTKRE